MTYEVHIGLRNGQQYTFDKNARSKEEIINEITNSHGNGWFHFVAKDYVMTRVLKQEIVSIGISMSAEEAREYENTLK